MLLAVFGVVTPDYIALSLASPIFRGFRTLAAIYAVLTAIPGLAVGIINLPTAFLRVFTI